MSTPLHNMNLGAPLDDDEITRLLSQHTEHPLLAGVLQLLRNECAACRDEAHALMEQGHVQASVLKLGSAQALQWLAERLHTDAHSDPS